MNDRRTVSSTTRTGSCSSTGTVRARLAFQQVGNLERTTWPDLEVPMQMHLDLTVSSLVEQSRQRDRAEALGATLRYDRTGDPDEPLYVLTDPAGHPFCIFVSARTGT